MSEYLVTRFSHALANGGRALVVGYEPDRLPNEFRRNPRIVVWPPDSPEARGQFDSLPERVRAVVTTKNMRHSDRRRLTRMAREHHVPFFDLVQPYEANAMMHTLTQPEAPKTNGTPVAAPPAPPDVAPESKPTPPEALVSMTAFIRHHYYKELAEPPKPGNQKGSPKPPEFYQRLAAHMTANGFTTNPTKALAIWSNTRTVVRREIEKERANPKVQTAVPVAQAAPTPPVELPVPSAEPLPADLEALLLIAEELDERALKASDLAEHLRRLAFETKDLRAIRDRFNAARSAFIE